MYHYFNKMYSYCIFKNVLGGGGPVILYCVNVCILGVRLCIHYNTYYIYLGLYQCLGGVQIPCPPPVNPPLDITTNIVLFYHVIE